MSATSTAPTVGTTTVATRVRDRAASDPTAVAMRHKDLGVWKEISWAEYWDTVLTTAHALLALGVEPGDRVSIQCENRPEWLELDIATVAVGAITVDCALR